MSHQCRIDTWKTIGQRFLESVELSNSALIKLRTKLKSEIRALNRLATQCSGVDCQPPGCGSNMPHLALIACCVQSYRIHRVFQKFEFRHANTTRSLIVDAVADDGAVWIKVKAQSAATVDRECGGGMLSSGVVKQAELLLQCAAQHPHLFKPPTVRFVFQSGVTHAVRQRLEDMGVDVQIAEANGELNVDEHHGVNTIESNSNSESLKSDSSAACCCQQCHRILCPFCLIHQRSASQHDHGMGLNLDITCLLALVSDLSNGGADHFVRSFQSIYQSNDLSANSLFIPHRLECQTNPSVIRSSCRCVCDSSVRDIDFTPIPSDVLTLQENLCGASSSNFKPTDFESELLQQASHEVSEPFFSTSPFSHRYSHWIVCQSAADKFNEIVSLLGDSWERARADMLLRHAVIVPDVEPKFAADSALNTVFGIRKSNRITKFVFGAGHHHRCVTITGNASVLRSAFQHGVELNAVAHRSVALTGGHLARLRTIEAVMDRD